MCLYALFDGTDMCHMTDVTAIAGTTSHPHKGSPPMPKIFATLAFAGVAFGMAAVKLSGPAEAGYVNGYYRNNGTYVQPHWRGAPDGYCFNNKAGC
jgi:hypothetical protein